MAHAPPHTAESFDQLGQDYLLSNWPSWKDDSCIKNSMLVPPIYSCKFPHISDEDIERAKPHCQTPEDSYMNPDGINIGLDEIKQRKGDKAELVVYSAVERLVAENHHRFLAIHGLNIYERSKEESMRAIFINKSAKQIGFHEHDFVLIGPRIGFVSIEVKGLDAPGASAIIKGTNQLRGFEEAVNFFREKLDGPNGAHITVEKVLYTPNLDETEWNASSHRTTVIKKCNSSGVHHWFTASEQLYIKLKSYLDSLEANDSEVDLRKSLYERYMPFFLGLAIGAEKTDMSVSEAAREVDELLSTQSYFQLPPSAPDRPMQPFKPQLSTRWSNKKMQYLVKMRKWSRCIGDKEMVR